MLTHDMLAVANLMLELTMIEVVVTAGAMRHTAASSEDMPFSSSSQQRQSADEEIHIIVNMAILLLFIRVHTNIWKGYSYGILTLALTLILTLTITLILAVTLILTLS